MYKNYVFDLYGTLIDINTDEWSIELWEKMAVYYGYKGAIYTAEELNEEYGKLVEAEKSLYTDDTRTTALSTLRLIRYSKNFTTKRALR